MVPDEDEQGCGPQPFAEALSHATPLERLSELASEALAAIAAGERAVTPNYWQLGRILMLARKRLPRGDWANYLATLGIEKTRASKARAIFRTFPTAAAAAGLSVAQAYERRARSPRVAGGRRSPLGEIEAEVVVAAPTQITLPHWVHTVERDAARLLDEVEFLTPSERLTLLVAIGRAAAVLTELTTAVEGRIAGDGLVVGATS